MDERFSVRVLFFKDEEAQWESYRSKCRFPAVPDAVLSCEFRTERDQNPRIEWKKKGKAVTFVYFNGKFTGE